MPTASNASFELHDASCVSPTDPTASGFSGIGLLPHSWYGIVLVDARFRPNDGDVDRQRVAVMIADRLADTIGQPMERQRGQRARDADRDMDVLVVAFDLDVVYVMPELTAHDRCVLGLHRASGDSGSDLGALAGSELIAWGTGSPSEHGAEPRTAAHFVEVCSAPRWRARTARSMWFISGHCSWDLTPLHGPPWASLHVTAV